jgi:hypothetical protein
MINATEQAMGIDANVRVDLLDAPRSDDGHRHRHVAIEWEGGVLWLDMSEQSDHFCVDVRQFVPATDCGAEPMEDQTGEHREWCSECDSPVELAGQGVFTIVNGRRQVLASGPRERGNFANTDPLEDPDGTPVLGHGWNGGYVVTLMHDKVPSEKQTNRPAGPGRG